MNDAELEKMAEEYAPVYRENPREMEDFQINTHRESMRNAFKAGYKKAREWVKTSERKPSLGDYHKHVLTCSVEGERRATMVGWIHNHPEAYPFWQDLPAKPEGVE